MAAAVMTACGGNAKDNRVTDTHASGTESIADHEHAEGHDTVPHSHEGEDDHADHDTDSHGAAEKIQGQQVGAVNSDEIIFPAAQAAMTDFEVRTVARGNFNNVIPASGQIVGAPGDEMTLVAPMSGVVTFADRQLANGRNVQAGSALFHVSSRNISSGDALARDASSYRKAKADLDRADKLLADKIVAQSEYDAIKAAYEQAKTAYDAMAGSVSDKGASVKTRIPGFVTSVSVNEGDYVETGQRLATVSQNRKLMLRVEVSQRYLDQLSGISSANFQLPYSDKVWSLDEMGGRLLSVSRTVTPQTPLIPVTFEFDNNGGVMPGSYVDVRLLGAPRANVLSVPVTAISEQQGLFYVYVQLDEEGYARREVKLGEDDGSIVEVLSGIEPGERVVTRGAVNLKMAASSGTIPHGHEH